MKKRNIWKKISGVAAVGTLAVSIILPAQAATEAARATYLEYFNAYRVYEGTKSAAVTVGGSAYDDRGMAMNAHLVAGVISNNGGSKYGYWNITGYDANARAESGFLDGVIQYVHNCEIGHV